MGVFELVYGWMTCMPLIIWIFVTHLFMLGSRIILMKGINRFGIMILLIIIIAIIVVLYFTGGAISKKSITIGACTFEWDTIARNVQSELCPDPNATCIAEPSISQHNAMADVILCACTNAGPGYADASVNSKIEDTYMKIMGINSTANSICESGQLTKWAYT